MTNRLCALCAGCRGVFDAAFAKSDLFCGVVMGGVLPCKTFSMGHAEEKRYHRVPEDHRIK